MERAGETAISTETLAPIYRWAQGPTPPPPPLVYRRVDRLADQPTDRDLVSGRVRMGGSYACYADRPWFGLRAALCEQNLSPYDLNTPYFQTRHGVFLWPRFNAYAFTDLRDPDTVYVRDRRARHHRWVARLHFGATQVTLTERAD